MSLSFAHTPRTLTWLVLAVLSAAIAAGLFALQLPAALLLGPMIAAIVLAGLRAELAVPAPLFLISQGFIGCLIARILPVSVSGEIAARWPLFLFGVLAVIAASTALGWLMSRLRVLPGTAALWGSSPGAATAMTLMAESYGADTRLVAFMQYLRVVMVAMVATVVSRMVGAHGAMAAASSLSAPLHPWSLLGTVILALSGPLLARVLPIPAGPLLIPMVLGIVLSHLGWLSIELPIWLLALCYAGLGWGFGLRFTRQLLGYVAHALPRVMLCIAALILVCAGLAGVMVLLAGIDPLTAYLATSPGGADSVAIIAASTHVDVPFVMAMQTARFVTVLVLTPRLNRLVASSASAPLSNDGGTP